MIVESLQIFLMRIKENKNNYRRNFPLLIFKQYILQTMTYFTQQWISFWGFQAALSCCTWNHFVCMNFDIHEYQKYINFVIRC